MGQLKTWEKIMVALFVLGMLVGGLGVVNQMQVAQNRKDDQTRQECNTTYINQLALALDAQALAVKQYREADAEYLTRLIKLMHQPLNGAEHSPPDVDALADAVEGRLAALEMIDLTSARVPFPDSPEVACSVQ